MLNTVRPATFSEKSIGTVELSLLGACENTLSAQASIKPLLYLVVSTYSTIYCLPTRFPPSSAS
jgi:hypothetical protein